MLHSSVSPVAAVKGLYLGQEWFLLTMVNAPNLLVHSKHKTKDVKINK
jgi:hypothetical protein